MAKFHHKVSAAGPEAAEPERLLATIQTFIGTCRNPAVLEYGEEIISLSSGNYGLDIRSGRLWIEVWSETRSISRRIVDIERQATGVLDCAIQRFGGAAGRLSFLDLDRPQSAHTSLCGIRQNFAEQFRRMLFRQFPGWEIENLSCSMDLQRSFSPVFPRARLSRGSQQIAAMACPNAKDEPAMLTFALIWHEHLRTHARKSIFTSLSLFLPDNSGNLTSQRLRWLDQGLLQPKLFRFNAHGSAGEIDPRDLGNLQTRVCATTFPNEAISAGIPEHNNRSVSERSLESAVRTNILRIDPSLLVAPVHGQVLAFSAGDRDLIDLLAVSASGRLAVLELKVSEDIHLPLQALDYWMRIAWHAERAELRHLFPGIELERRPPRLLLLAPAISFHPSNATILRYFSPEIEVERVGVNSDWQQHLRVVLRLQGADAPISHGGF